MAMDGKPRLLAIGDVHGCSRALDALLGIVAPTPDDTLIFLGDYIDRGPDSRGVLDRLSAMTDGESCVALRGNHDEWMLRARQDKRWFRSWLGVGGIETLESYGAASFDDVPAAHWDFLENTLHGYEAEPFLFAHGSLRGDLPLEAQDEEWLLWKRVGEAKPHFSGMTLVCGHTIQKNGVPLHLGHAICIDTGACAGGWLSCLSCEDLYLWQANQEGDTRHGRLSDFLR